MLPMAFALLGAAALILGLFALWQSLRHAFGASGDAATWTSTSESMERQGLLEEKRSLLESIKDLEFEHQVGKINDKDFERLDRQLRARAREVLRLLDQDIGPYRDRAEALIRNHLKKAVGSTPYREPEEPSDANVRTCPECGTVNDVDAKFCKECAHGFREGAEARAGSKKKKGKGKKPSAKKKKRDEAEPTVSEADEETGEAGDEGDADEADADEPKASGEDEAAVERDASGEDAEADDEDEEDER